MAHETYYMQGIRRRCDARLRALGNPFGRRARWMRRTWPVDRRGGVDLSGLHFKKYNLILEPEEAVHGLSIYNPIVMDSACRTPPFTNYTSGFNGCLDYIFLKNLSSLLNR